MVPWTFFRNQKMMIWQKYKSDFQKYCKSEMEIIISVRTQFLGPLCLWQCLKVFVKPTKICFQTFYTVFHNALDNVQPCWDFYCASLYFWQWRHMILVQLTSNPAKNIPKIINRKVVEKMHILSFPPSSYWYLRIKLSIT